MSMDVWQFKGETILLISAPTRCLFAVSSGSRPVSVLSMHNLITERMGVSASLWGHHCSLTKACDDTFGRENKWLHFSSL